MLGHLTAEQIEQVLRTEMIGRIGCHTGGRTYVVPINYTYDGASVYCHSADGMKIQMMRKNLAEGSVSICPERFTGRREDTKIIDLFFCLPVFLFKSIHYLAEKTGRFEKR